MKKRQTVSPLFRDLCVSNHFIAANWVGGFLLENARSTHRVHFRRSLSFFFGFAYIYVEQVFR